MKYLFEAIAERLGVLKKIKEEQKYVGATATHERRLHVRGSRKYFVNENEGKVGKKRVDSIFELHNG